jgi:hypothetical protein
MRRDARRLRRAPGNVLTLSPAAAAAPAIERRDLLLPRVPIDQESRETPRIDPRVAPSRGARAVRGNPRRLRQRKHDCPLLRRTPARRRPIAGQSAMAALVVDEPGEDAGLDRAAPATLGHRGGVAGAEGGTDHGGPTCQILPRSAVHPKPIPVTALHPKSAAAPARAQQKLRSAAYLSHVLDRLRQQKKRCAVMRLRSIQAGHRARPRCPSLIVGPSPVRFAYAAVTSSSARCLGEASSNERCT